MSKNLPIFKIITLGNSGVGKTSILNRFISGKFVENTNSTIGIEFSMKQLTIKNNITITLKLVDTCGQEKYRSISKQYFRNCDAVFFVFAFNNKNSFEDIKDWITLFGKNHNGKENIPKILVGNKCDINSKDIEQNLIDNFEKDQNIKFIETSAKDNLNINNLFQEIAEILFDNYNQSGSEKKSQNTIKVNENKMEKKNCCLGMSDL